MTQNAKEKIIELNWNQFLYGERTDKREKFLKELATSAPIQTSVDAPMAIYIPTDSFITTSKLNGYQVRLKTMAREQVNFAILEAILEEILRTFSEETISTIEPEILEYFNHICKNPKPIKSLKELLEVIKSSNRYHKTNFMAETDEKEIEDIDTLSLPFIELDEILKIIKEALKNNSNFMFIIDHNSPLNIYSCQAINTLIGMRALSDMSIKVATSDWPDYRCLNEEFYIQITGDYMTVNLDELLESQVEEKQEFVPDVCELGGFAKYRSDIDGDEAEFNAFNYCLASDYLSALWGENFEALGEIDAELLNEVAEWLNYDGEIGKDQIDVIENIPTGKLLTYKHRTFADATIAHKKGEVARALIYNGNRDVNLFLTVVLYSDLFQQEKDGILNFIPCNTKEEYLEYLSTIFQAISTYYGSLKTPEEKEKFLLQVRPAIIGIHVPEKYKNDRGIQELIEPQTGGWQMRLKEITNK